MADPRREEDIRFLRFLRRIITDEAYHDDLTEEEQGWYNELLGPGIFVVDGKLIKYGKFNDGFIYEVMGTLLETFGPLQPRECEEVIERVLGEEPKKIFRKNGKQWAANMKTIRFRQVQTYQRSQNLFHHVDDTDRLGEMMRLYGSKRRREERRDTIFSVIEGADVEERKEKGYLEKAYDEERDLEGLLKRLTEENEDRLGEVETIPAIEPEYSDWADWIDPRIISGLAREGIERPYTHQAASFESWKSGRNVLVTTPNASGKTLCYIVPVFDALLKDPEARFLYITPTKALAQDQERRIQSLADKMGLSGRVCARYDGSISFKEKRDILSSPPAILLTNPDQFHFVLARHPEWAGYFKKLSAVIIDEVHIYTGVFGSHVSNVLKRLRLICHTYGAEPRFLATSATIGNPDKHLQNLVGMPFDVIMRSGSPSGPKRYLFWDPLRELEDGQISSGHMADAQLLLREHVKSGVKTIMFARTRNVAEVVVKNAKADLESSLRNTLAVYRAGLSPELRTEIQEDFQRGAIMGLGSTNALELGIDIGDVDTTVLLGYPGSISSFRQQANRAGRTSRESAVIFVPLPEPVDQYLVDNPKFLLEGEPERSVIDPDTVPLLKFHRDCLRFELEQMTPDTVTSLREWVEEEEPALVNLMAATDDDIADFPEEDGVGDTGDPDGAGEASGTSGTSGSSGGSTGGVGARKGGARGAGKGGASRPHRRMSLRNTSPFSYLLKADGKKTIGDADRERVIKEFYPGGVYLHQGDEYVVENVDHKRRQVQLERADVSYITLTRSQLEVYGRKDVELEVKPINHGISLAQGPLNVVERILDHVEVDLRTFTELRSVPHSGSENTIRLYTEGLAFLLPAAIVDTVEAAELSAGTHAIEHTVRSLLPLFVACSPGDISGGIVQPRKGLFETPGFIVYDNCHGGMGITRAAVDLAGDILLKAFDVISSCSCDNGCPRCILTQRCSTRRPEPSKAAAISLIAALRALK